VSSKRERWDIMGTWGRFDIVRIGILWSEGFGRSEPFSSSCMCVGRILLCAQFGLWPLVLLIALGGISCYFFCGVLRDSRLCSQYELGCIHFSVKLVAFVCKGGKSLLLLVF